MDGRTKWLIRRWIHKWIELGMKDEDIIRRIMEGYTVSEDTAEEHFRTVKAKQQSRKGRTYYAGRFTITIE